MIRSVRLRTCAAPLLAVLALALGGAGCGSDDGDDGSSRDAKALLSDTFAKEVDSGDLELGVKADVEGVKSLEDPVSMTLDGPFKSNGTKKLPTLDWDFVFDGAGQKISGGLIATRDNAFLELQGQAYEVGEDVFARLSRDVASTQPERRVSPGKLGMHPEKWLEDPKVEDGEPIGGDETRRITGSVDVRKVVQDFVNLLESPTVRKQLERQGQSGDTVKPSRAEVKEIEEAIEDVDVELDVDDNDVLRRFAAEVRFKDPDKEEVKGKLDLTYVLRKVGIDPVIRAPADPRPLGELLGGFGLGGLGSGPATPRD